MDAFLPDDPFPQTPDEKPHPLLKYLEGFQAGCEYSELSPDEQNLSTEIIDDFSYYMWFYQDLTPGSWTREGVERTLLVHYPRSLVHCEEYIMAVPAVLSRFLAYCASSNEPIGAEDLLEIIPDSTNRFYCRMDESRHWGPKKAFIFLALAAGVDSSQDDAMHSFIHRFIQNQVPGKDEQTISSLTHVLYYWLFPFSDSQELASLDPDSYRHCASVISTLMKHLVIVSGIPPMEWTGSDVSRSIEDHLRSSPDLEGRREYLIPILSSFFSFLSKEQLQPHAEEICQAISSSDRLV